MRTDLFEVAAVRSDRTGLECWCRVMLTVLQPSNRQHERHGRAPLESQLKLLEQPWERWVDKEKIRHGAEPSPRQAL